MENEKWQIDNKERNSAGEKLSIADFPLSTEKICSACGANAVRIDAKFCLVCGKILSEDYEPLDRLRASYRLQWKSFSIENREQEKVVNLFERNENSASETAKALVVYSLVPYLGILFCPFALFSGGFGIFTAYRKPNLGGWHASIYSVALTFIIFTVQIFLWWLLYIIPELGK